ncbi:hypothetical protein A2141_02070 [Candidatus Woesebacteria bacterium RBG_16_40_11]|nr:MAG: hypothetical protein A2141_02070 [Candidatus Woesebacteria bacterium RBG_16_40_11]
MQPWPISWTYVQLGQRAKNSPSRRLFSEPGGSQNRRSRAVGKEHKRLKILKSHLASISDNSRKIRDVSEKSPDNTQEITKLILDVVQLEGKGGVSWKQFLEGYPEAKFI